MCKEQIVEIIKANIDSLETKNWDDFMEQVIFNFLEIDFTSLIQDYQPCSENDLYLSEFQLMETIGVFTFHKLSGLKEEEIRRFLKTGVKILVKKQQNKYFNTSFSTCPIPETGKTITAKTYEKLDKFVKNEKFNYLNKKGITSQINSNHAKVGTILYNEMVRNGSPRCEIFASPANLIHLYMLFLYPNLVY